MAKEDNKSVLSIDGFDGLNDSRSSEQMQAEALGIAPKDNYNRQTKGALPGLQASEGVLRAEGRKLLKVKR